MPHSLLGYLTRQSTEDLERILQAYQEAEPSDLNDMIIQIILDLLQGRGSVLSIPATGQLHSNGFESLLHHA